ncbi:uncharacterized protein [Montipora capricornis]|uniref:uncharacterized protein n=1 Tax=Montipora capricornis TaxID=246305 RepID=UPI0035F1DC07
MKLFVLFFLLPCVACRSQADVGSTEEPSEEPVPEGITYKPVGCFKDRFSPRAMPELLKNFRGTIDWNHLDKIVEKCAEEAMNKRQEYFGIQFWGECWAGEDSDLTYDQYGEDPSGCYENLVGMAMHNMVYKFDLPE